jgi:response regulator of citrate/malate metabolism
MVSSSTNTADKLKAAEYNPIFQYLEKPVQVENFENLKKLDHLKEYFNNILNKTINSV